MRTLPERSPMHQKHSAAAAPLAVSRPVSRRAARLSLVLAASYLATGAGSASAQILIWNLPKQPGGWVRFEGTYRQTRARPNNNAGDERLEWRSELSISSVGAEPAEYEGARVPCRWVEFKTVIKAPDLERQAGPAGTTIYKMLIPESRVTGKITDDGDIPVMFLPVVRGYRKLGEGAAEAVAERALSIYSTVAPLTYYADLKPDGDQPVELSLPFANRPVAARVFKGSRVLSDSVVRSTNAATLWRSDDVPFGLARFSVTVTREEKDADAPPAAFRRTSLIEAEMQAVAAGNDAKSELPEQQ